jgi:hypothetical protein
MYPISFGFHTAEERINKLMENGHHAEALVTAVFTFEKLVMRSLRGAIVARGFTSAQADKIIGPSGLNRLKEMWVIYDKDHRRLIDHIPARDWQIVTKAVEWRNKMAHGKQSYILEDCKNLAVRILGISNEFRATINTHHGVDPWSRYKIRRVPRLQWFDPSSFGGEDKASLK